MQVTHNIKNARAGNRKMKATCILKMQCKDFVSYKSHDLVKNKKKLVRNEFFKIFVSVRWFQYLLEGPLIKF